jgi:hypothetical protein
MIEQLHRLREEVERRASLMSAAAQEEWQRVRARIPTLADADAGVTASSEEELEVLTSKISRLTQLLRTLDQPAPASPRPPG